MKRRIRRTLVILSLVLCAASTTLWVRSHFRWDAIITRRPAHGMAVRSTSGQVGVDLKWSDRVTTVERSQWRTSSDPDPFLLDSDPLRIERWNWDILMFRSAPAPTFRWEWVQAVPPNTAPQGPHFQRATSGARPTIGDQYLRIKFPYWLPTCVFGLWPGIAALSFGVTHWRRYRRLLAGRCPLCGYDLRATPGRCSECGWSFDSAPAAWQQSRGLMKWIGLTVR